ncbi:hypothetical protein BCV70DRAFT_201402 [Testicularia cyperi]|uniref:CTLH domain-containing protein n=1 Tax=Testicularia cyperi TaxID=1882483 RepID=A0A317XP71_9BASI|nr:hypothetical protein BCV70DRAFT_201402 [Testicularia cyperi]
MADVMAIDPPAAAATGDSITTATAASGSNRPNLDGILLLEAPFAKLPFDELRRQQKTQQRLIERELLVCTTTFNDLSKSLSSQSSAAASGTAGESSGRAELERSLEATLGRLRGLKRKLTPLAEQATSSLRMAQSRVDHLQALHQIEDADSVEFSEWSKTRLDRMLVDYMFRKDYRDAAIDLANRRGINDLVDAQLFGEIARIHDSIRPPDWHYFDQKGAIRHEYDASGAARPNCALALAWCSENKATLRKIKTPLEFNLRLQEYIELARVRTPDSIREAIAYARRHLLPLMNANAPSGSSTGSGGSTSAPSVAKPASSGAVASSATSALTGMLTTGAGESEKDREADHDRQAAEAIRKQVSRALGLLACGPGSDVYADLYDPMRWVSLQRSFKSCALQIHSMPAQPILHIALSAGLSSLKLPTCYTADTPTHILGGKTEIDEIVNDLAERRVGIDADRVTVSGGFPPAMGGIGAGSLAGGLSSMSGSGVPTPGMLGVGNTGPSSTTHAHAHAHAHAHTGFKPDPTAGPGVETDPRAEIKNIDCPICDSTGLGVLANEVPWSHHQNSTLVCSYSGSIMDDNNPPMALPNGRVYAQNSILEIAAQDPTGQSITCPRTNQTFPLHAVRKVFTL